MTLNRVEKFARILAIADVLSAETVDRRNPTIEARYRVELTRNPKKVFGLINRDLIQESHKWGEKEMLLFDVFTEEVANLELEEFTNDKLDETFYHRLGVAKVEMRNVIGVDEAAEILNISPGTVKNKCAANEIPAKKIGKTWVINRRELESFT